MTQYLWIWILQMSDVWGWCLQRTVVQSWEQEDQFGSQPLKIRPRYSPLVQLWQPLQMLHHQTLWQALHIQKKKGGGGETNGKWHYFREVTSIKHFWKGARLLTCSTDFALIAENETSSIPGGIYLHCTCYSTKYKEWALSFRVLSVLIALTDGLHHLSFLDRGRESFRRSVPLSKSD